MNTEWKDIYFEQNGVIYDYRGLYQVSNQGNVKSLERLDSLGRTVKEKVLNKIKHKNDYEKVKLCKNGKYKDFLVHRLVAYMFVENDDPINKTQVNHKDEDTTNNNTNNLEWCTSSYNANYGTRNKRTSQTKKDNKIVSGCNHPRAKKIAQYDLDGNLIKIWDYIRQVEKELLGKNKHQAITKCCKGEQKTAYGFIWKYVKEDDK